VPKNANRQNHQIRNPSSDWEGSQPLTETVDHIWRRSPEIIKRFLDLRRDHEQLCAEVEYILRKKLAEQTIEVSAVNSRAKTLNSFLQKLQRKGYENPFEQITDLAGSRVVCLYRSDIANIAEIIRSDFDVIEDVDKLDELGVDHFGYGARHFLVRLGKNSSGARYDDLKQLVCEIQVRTVVQDAWAIIQHHLVYKRESQVPKLLQRKLNSLAGLFETVDDQFESIRRERETYIAEIRESIGRPAEFLENELNLDSFKEYLGTMFPDRPVERFDGQARMALDGLRSAGLNTLKDLDTLLKHTSPARQKLMERIVDKTWEVDGKVPSNLEPGFALAISSQDWDKLIPWGPVETEIRRFREELGSSAKRRAGP
jgi:putative GTP pyrophosphokinase